MQYVGREEDDDTSRTFEEVGELIWRDPDALSEQEIESYLNIAEVEDNLNKDKFLGLLRFG